MNRRTIVVVGGLVSAAALLAGCGDGGSASERAKRGNPAMPAPDPARAAKVNGYGPDGQPIDAVAAAEMPEAQLPALKGEGAGAPPDAPPAPPYKKPPGQ